MPRPGDPAPDFCLRDQHGQSVRLSEFRGRKNVVLFFYPKDNTPVCTVEACSFRDEFAAFEGAEAVLLGLSGDDEASHRGFAQKHQLPFQLLSDPGHLVAKSYDALMAFGLLADRVTFVIDTAGVIRQVVHGRLSGSKHVREAKAALQLIASPG